VPPSRADAGDATWQHRGPEGADDPDYQYEGEGEDASKSGRSSRAARARKFPYGADFETGALLPRGSPSPAPARGAGAGKEGPARPAAADPAAWNDGSDFPSVVASGLGGRNVLKIRMPAKNSSSAAPIAGGGGGGGDAGGDAGGDILAMLARAADGIRTPKAAGAGAGGGLGSGTEGGIPPPPAAPAPAPVAAAPAPAPARSSEPAARVPMALLSKSLTRNEGGSVTGARLALRWEPGSRAAAEVSRRLSEFGLRHHAAAEIDEYEVDPSGCSVRLTLRLAAAGRVDVLERAIVDLLEAV
jgi:hypothetical protein